MSPPHVPVTGQITSTHRRSEVPRVEAKESVRRFSSWEHDRRVFLADHFLGALRVQDLRICCVVLFCTMVIPTSTEPLSRVVSSHNSENHREWRSVVTHIMGIIEAKNGHILTLVPSRNTKNARQARLPRCSRSAFDGFGDHMGGD